MVVDTANFASVRKFVQEFAETKLPLHLLLNNAGMFGGPYGKSADGFETQLATNHLGSICALYSNLEHAWLCFQAHSC